MAGIYHCGDYEHNNMKLNSQYLFPHVRELQYTAFVFEASQFLGINSVFTNYMGYNSEMKHFTQFLTLYSHNCTISGKASELGNHKKHTKIYIFTNTFSLHLKAAMSTIEAKCMTQ